jgi:hypothetical protein
MEIASTNQARKTQKTNIQDTLKELSPKNIYTISNLCSLSHITASLKKSIQNQSHCKLMNTDKQNANSIFHPS